LGLGRRLFILIPIVLGGVLSAALFTALARQPHHRQLVGGKPLEYWVQCLDSGNVALRESAITNLPLFGGEAAPALVEHLDADSPEVAEAASSCLAKIGSPAVPAMTAALHARTATPARANAVIDLLARMGPAASEPAAKEIAARLQDPSTGHAATEYFLKCGPTPDALASAAKALAGKDDYRRKDALRVFKAAQGDPRASDALAVALQNATDANVRGAIWKELCAAATLSPAAIVQVARGLASAETRSDARAALLMARAPAAGPLAALARQDDVDDITRIAALDTLSQILIRNRPAFATTAGAATADMESALQELTHHPAPLVRIAADDCLAVLYSLPGGGPLPPPGGGPVPISAVAANLPKMTPAGTPLEISSTIAPATAPAVIVRRNPVLDAALAQLEDGDPKVRASAENAVRYLAPAPDPSWLDYANAPDGAERIRRVRLLPFSSDTAKKYDVMIAASRESDPAVRKAAFGAMRRSLDSPKVIDRLIAALEKDESIPMRLLAADILASARDINPRARAALTAAANGIGTNPKVAAAAKAALGK
jgi:hypothetical protein